MRTLKLTKKIIGYVGVDSGMLLISDPCYILHRDDSSFNIGKDWLDFCKNYKSQLSNNQGIPLAVNLDSFGGDGVFEVIGEFDGKLLKKITIEF